MKTGKMRVLSSFLLLLMACALCFSQTISGDLSGAIFDPSGAAVPSANVIVKNESTGVEVSTKSSTLGEYHVGNLPAGKYTIIVTATGFTKAEVHEVDVVLNRNTTTNVKLEVGANIETVQVTAATVSIDTTTATVQNSFQSSTLTDLPITSTGSGVINLSLLNAGISTSGATGLGTGPSIGGQRPRNNNFTIEGIDNNSGSVTGPVVTIPNDGVAEFTVQQNQISPEFGHSSGGQFNQVVQSGGNDFHGRAYEYLLN